MLVVCAAYQLSRAQYYSTGQDRASIVWREIETASFQLVYPNYFEKEAQRMANLLMSLYECNAQSLQVQPKKVSILLHAETTKSNGYFAWAPRRGELYTTPPDAGLANDWLEHLATHEYRHVVQMDKLDEGLPDLLNIIFGEQAVPAILSYKVPMWFMEGDAVLTETLLSTTGRGRSPGFLQVMKAYLLGNKGWYTYNKALFGSYKDFVPSVYEMGYFMVANTRKNYGKSIWNDALQQAAKKPYPWYNFVEQSISKLKREKILTSLLKTLDSIGNQENTYVAKDLKIVERWRDNKHRNETVTLYNDNMTELQSRWRQQQTYFDTTSYKTVSPQAAIFTNYDHPQMTVDGGIIALKSGYENYTQFVKIKDGEEQSVLTPGNVNGAIYLSNNLLYWTESIPDVRWAERSKSVIYYLDLETAKKRKIAANQNLYMPSANQDNSLIVAVAKNAEYTNEIIVVERQSGKVKFRHQFGSTRITTPRFIAANKVAYIFTDEGTGIASLDLLTGQVELLVATHNVPLADLSYDAGMLYFTSGYEGKNDIYSLTLANLIVQKLTEAPFGAVQASRSGENLIYANYTNKGYEIVSVPLSEALLQETQATNWVDDELLKSIQEEAVCNGKLVVSDSLFESKYYRKSKHLFNFHSRSPFASSATVSRGYDLGVSTTSQNLLSTMFVNVGYRQKNGYKNGQFYGNMIYKGWFPVIATELTYGKQERHLFSVLEKEGYIDKATIAEQKNRWKWQAQVSLPFNISRGKYFRHFSVAAGLEFTKDVNVKQTYLSGTGELSRFAKGDPIDLRLEKTHQLLNYSFSFSNLHKAAYRDLYSPFGQQFTFTYRHTPFDKENVYTYAVEGVVYLPSFLKHHGVRMYAGYQYQPEQSEFLKDNIEQARGTISLLTEKKYTLMINYKFPLAYPDWSLGSALYVKRLNTNLFYDYTLAEIKGFSKNVYAYGADFTADAHIIQIPIPIRFGIRLGYETQSSSAFYSTLLAISF